MTKRMVTLLSIGVAIAAAAALGFSQVAVVELTVIALSLFLLPRLARPAGLVEESTRLVLGVPLYLAGFALGVASSTLVGADAPETGRLLRHVPLLFPGLALAWSLLSIHRLSTRDRKQRRVRIAIVVLAGFFLVGLAPNTGLATVAAVCAALWAVSRRWVGELATRRRSRLLLLVLVTPCALLFAARTTMGQQSPLPIRIRAESGGIYSTLGTFAAVYWVTVCLSSMRVAIRAATLRMPIRVRLLFTYLSSTIVPGLLAVGLILVAVFAGIGALQARNAKNLVIADLDSLQSTLVEGGPLAFAAADSVAEAVYLRAAVDSVAAGPERDAEGPPTVPSMLLEAAAGALSVGGRRLMEPGPAGQYGARCASATAGEIWVRVASRSSWVPPDTIPPIPGWTDSSTAASSILPLGRAKTGYAAAVPVDGHRCLVRLLLQPLNRAVLDRYKRIIGCDVILEPTSRLGSTKLMDRVVVGVDEPSGMWTDAPAVATVPKEHEAGLLHKSLYHGISELQLPRGAGGENEIATIVAFVVVRTSLAELGSALYALGGMNSLVVIVLFIMTALILTAVLISSLLGFSLSRSITSSVAALKRGTERLRKGDLDTTIRVTTRDELGELADSFNQMASDLKRMVQEVARRERLAREIQIAREIQVNMLPGELPKVEGYELAGASSPAFEVAGDYYDAMLLDQDRLAVVVADVSGKGVAAAMLMSNLQASLKVLLQQRRPLHRLAERLNLLTYRNSTPDMFITLFVGVIDLKGGELEYVNSGHDPPVIVREDGTLDLHSTGLLLGVLPDVDYGLARIALQPGDYLVLYSDGIIDAMNDSEEEFGRERLMAALRELRGRQASAIVPEIMRRVREHVGTSGAPKDDLTLLVIRVCADIARRGGAPSQRAAS